MDATISLESLLQMLSRLSLSKRKWLADHLVEPWEREDVNQRQADEEFVRDFLSTPYDNPTSADEAKNVIREHRYYSERNLKPLHDGE